VKMIAWGISRITHFSPIGPQWHSQKEVYPPLGVRGIGT
jgi:hypothetical protein